MIKTLIKINKFKIKNLKKDGLKALNKGKFKAKRILSPQSILELTVKYADGPFASDIDFMGVYNGLGVYVLDDPSLMQPITDLHQIVEL